MLVRPPGLKIPDHINPLHLPDYYAHSVSQIDFDYLYDKCGKRFAIVDVDGTIAPYFSELDLHASSKIMSSKLRRKLLGLVLLSNCRLSFFFFFAEIRVAGFAKQLSCPYYCASIRFHKPRAESFRRAIELLKSKYDQQLDHSQIIVIGDQIFTDIVGGNSFEPKLHTLLVDPLKGWEPPWIRWKRKKEAPIRDFIRQNYQEI